MLMLRRRRTGLLIQRICERNRTFHCPIRTDSRQMLTKLRLDFLFGVGRRTLRLQFLDLRHVVRVDFIGVFSQ